MERLTQYFECGAYVDRSNIVNISELAEQFFEKGAYMGKAIDKLAEFEDFMEKQGFESLEDLQHKINSWVNEEQVKEIAENSIKDYLLSNEIQKEINNIAIYKAMWQKLKMAITSIDNANWISKQGVLIAMQELEKEGSK